MSEQPPTYAVGQEVNGYRWTGTEWEPVAPAAAPVLTAPTAQPEARAKKPIWKRWWFWVLAVLLLITIASALGGGGGDKAATTTPSATPTSSSTDAGGEEPTESEPAEPSEEPSSEEPPAADPVDEARAAFDETFGTFAPIIKSGSGDSIIKLPAGVTSGLVSMQYKGSSNFAVSVIDAANEPTGDLLANEIGSWVGNAPFGVNSFGNEPAKLEVTGQGSWTIKIAPISSAKQIGIPGAGKGTGTFLYVGDVSDWTMTHKGTSNFSVITITPDGGGDLLVNEIGKYAGTVAASPGPVLIEIGADGAWTIKPAS